MTDTHDSQRAALAQVLSTVALSKEKAARPKRPQHPASRANLVEGDITRFWTRCSREGCRGAAVRGSTACIAHGGGAALQKRGKLNPKSAARGAVLRMARRGELPAELVQHPAFVALARRPGKVDGDTLARLTLAYLDMIDTGETHGWTTALQAARDAVSW